jgi:hypothetical protein
MLWCGSWRLTHLPFDTSQLITIAVLPIRRWRQKSPNRSRLLQIACLCEQTEAQGQLFGTSAQQLGEDLQVFMAQLLFDILVYATVRLPFP